jgi:hypothetical protein
VNVKSLAATLGFAGIVLPATLTLIFKNGCNQNTTSAPDASRTNHHRRGHSFRAGAPGNPSTDISTNFLQIGEQQQKAP